MTDLDFNTSALSSDTSTYREEEVESMLGYIYKNATIYTTSPKIQRQVAKIEATKTNRLKRSLTITLQPFGFPSGATRC